jgi:hypothetical protein
VCGPDCVLGLKFRDDRCGGRDLCTSNRELCIGHHHQSSETCSAEASSSIVDAADSIFSSAVPSMLMVAVIIVKLGEGL